MTIDISDNDTTSSAADISGYTLFGLEWPASMTGTQVTVQVLSGDGSTWKDLAQEGASAVSIAKDDSDVTGLDASALEFAAFRSIRFVSDQSEGADRTLYLHCKG